MSAPAAGRPRDPNTDPDLELSRVLVRQLAEAAGTQYALFGAVDEARRSVATIAVWARDGFEEGLTYELAGTPCENVVERGLCVYTSGVRSVFPDDRLFVELAVDSYAGMPVRDVAGQPRGIVAVFDTQAIDESRVTPALGLFAARAQAELGRLDAQAALDESERRETIAQVSISRRDEILNAVAHAAEGLLRADSWRDAVADTLRLLGRAAGADRSFLYECTTDQDGSVASRMTSEWVAEGISPSIGTALWQAYREAPEDVERFLRGEPVRFATADAWPEKRAALEAEGTQATLVVPILADGQLWGLLGLDDCQAARLWTQLETEALRVAAGTLGAAVERTRARAETEARDRVLGAVAKAAETLLQAEQWEAAIEDVLAILGRATLSGRAYMFETTFAEDGQLISSMRYEWTADGVQPTISLSRWQGYHERGRHATRLLAGEPASYHAADDEPDDRAAYGEEDTLVYVSVPIRARGRLWGYLGFDDCEQEREWLPLELEALRGAAGTIGAAMERELSEARLNAREEILEAVTVGAELLLRAESWRDAIDELLELLGRAGTASRCWLFECEEVDGAVRSTLTHEWVCPGVTRSQVEAFWTDRVEPPQAVEAFTRGKPLQSLREDLPREAGARLAAEGTLSIICVPVLVDGRLVAYLGYDDCETPRRWSPAEEEALRTAASVLGSSMQRAQGLETLRRRERMLAAVAAAAGRALTALTTEEAIEAVLAEIGTAAEASRVFASHVERREDGLLAITKNFQWAAPGFAVADREVWEGLATTPETAAAFDRGEQVQGLSRDVEGPFRDALDATGTLSFAVVPIMMRGEVWGSIGFNDCARERTWDVAEIEALRAAAGALGSVIERDLSIEALRASNERLWQARKMEAVGRLAAGLAHDLRNYLTVVVSYATFMRERLPEGDTGDAEALLTAAARIGDLIDRLLAFSRPQDTVTLEVLDIGAVVRDVESVVRALLPETHTLSVSVAPGLDPVLLDRGQFERVIVNLALNARDAMPGPGTLTIVARPDAAGVALEVTDTGVGMDDATRARAFEPFFTTKAGQGTGLGLPMVYGIVTGSGGSVDLTTVPGAGTCVTVHLPRA